MLATLPMYDWPEVRDATDLFWSALAKELGESGTLNRLINYADAWLQPDLVFSQTCSYPFTHQLRGRVTYVATPHYNVDGCDGPNYSSILFGREAKPLAAYRGCHTAISTTDSMSGMLALHLATAKLAANGPFFATQSISGGHVNSLIMVQDGKADLCAIDCVCVALARTYRPQLLEGLVEVGRSPSVPGLPIITQAGNVAALRSALQVVFADEPLKQACKTMLLSGYSVLEPKAYDVILDLENSL